MPSRLPRFIAGCKAASCLFALIILGQRTARADWERDDTTIAWRNGTNIVWRFSFDPKKGKPFFHPLSVGGNPSITNFKPEDHPWHYGLWFSWKYINHVNYWEEDRSTGHAQGATHWTTPVIETQADGSATIRLDLTYVTASNQTDMAESRTLHVSAPAADGSYAIDWRAHFVAGKNGALLDRTPMPGEPEGKVNGGYGGLGLRMASQPLTMTVVSTGGPIAHFESDRARPAAAAVACNFTDGTNSVGGVAILTDPATAGENQPWYLINSPMMRFACPAILAPKPIAVAPGGTLDLHYCLALRAQGWTVETLQAKQTQWSQSKTSPAEKTH